MIALHLTTTLDRNGNPRRGWLLLTDLGDPWAHTVGWIDEGYQGRSALTDDPRYAEILEGPSLKLAPAEWSRHRRHALEVTGQPVG